MPLAGGQGGRNLRVQLTLLQPEGQIMSTTLLLAHLDLKTQRHICHIMETKLLTDAVYHAQTPTKGEIFINFTKKIVYS